MTRSQTRTAAIAAALVAAVAAPHAARAGEAGTSTGTILVTAVDFKDDGGEAIVALYRRGEHWLEPPRAFRLARAEIKKGRVSVSFRDVPHDTYAVAVIHDENGNGKLDMRWVPYPKPLEGAGVSNNHIRRGKPEYDKARFVFDRSLMSVRIRMHY